MKSPEGIASVRADRERREQYEQERKEFWLMWSGKQPVDKVRVIRGDAGYSSQKWHVVHPLGIKTDAVSLGIQGSFGGRYEQVESWRFTYVAYTD